jgi:hypothetical protein
MQLRGRAFKTAIRDPPVAEDRLTPPVAARQIHKKFDQECIYPLAFRFR